jgi:ABC-2 type transport system ATP-binding protein
MVLQGTVEELARRVLGGAYSISMEIEGPPELISKTLQDLRGATGIRQMDSHLYEVKARRDLRADAAQAVIESGGRLLRLDVETQSLEDIYARYFEEVEHDVSNR